MQQAYVPFSTTSTYFISPLELLDGKFTVQVSCFSLYALQSLGKKWFPALKRKKIKIYIYIYFIQRAHNYLSCISNPNLLLCHSLGEQGKTA